MILLGEAGDDRFCSVNLINEGVKVYSGDCVSIQFRGCGQIESYKCKLDKGSFVRCELISTLFLFISFPFVILT